MNFRRSLPFVLAGWASLQARPSCAQVESALLSKVSFNLSNPGGKSLAMGGAFTAIADDATAALANPAGLGLLSSFEVGLSAKRTDDAVGLVTARSTATGGLTASYGPVRGVNSDLSDTRSDVDFAGVVIPVSSRFVAAVLYAQNLRFFGDPGPDGYAYIELRDNRSGGTTRRDFLYEYREFGTVSLSNRLFGVSFAYRVSDRLRLGAGVSLDRLTFALDGDAGGPHRIVSRNVLTPTMVETRTVTLGVTGFGQTKPSFLFGVHADLLPQGKLTAGAALRLASRTSGTLVLGGDVPDALAGQTSRRFRYGVPSDAAVGVAGQPMPGLTIAAEAQWIGYGGATPDALSVVSYAGLAGPSPGVPVDGLLAQLSPSSDVVVPRLGVEYVASTPGLSLAFRVGYHREPAHGVTANLVARDGTGTPYDVTDPPLSNSVRTVFDGGRPDDRFSAGLGATIQGTLSLDLAFDVGRSARQLALSAFYRF